MLKKLVLASLITISTASQASAKNYREIIECSGLRVYSSMMTANQVELEGHSIVNKLKTKYDYVPKNTKLYLTGNTDRSFYLTVEGDRNLNFRWHSNVPYHRHNEGYIRISQLYGYKNGTNKYCKFIKEL